VVKRKITQQLKKEEVIEKSQKPMKTGGTT
jgi:hypothetical protein